MPNLASLMLMEFAGRTAVTLLVTRGGGSVLGLPYETSGLSAGKGVDDRVLSDGKVSLRRGSGKTVMLNHAEATARDAGWLVVSENATAGLIDDW